jgi:hypothetical protein
VSEIDEDADREDAPEDAAATGATRYEEPARVDG